MIYRVKLRKDPASDPYYIGNLQNGIIFTQNINDELDSATINLVHVGIDIDIEPYDYVEISVVNNNVEIVERTMLVASYQKTIASIEPNSEKSNFLINLMSLTKLLETIQLPSMTLTNIGQNRTIAYMVNKVLGRYGKIKNKANNSVKTHSLRLDDTLGAYLNTIIAPEYTISNPTLREYLDYLFSKINALAYIDDTYAIGNASNITLKSKSLMPSNNPLAYGNKFITLDRSNNAINYASNLQTIFNNVIATNDLTEVVSLKSNSPLLDTNNGKIILNHPIYDITRVEFISDVNATLVFTNPNPNDTTNIKTITANIDIVGSSVDITDSVVTKDIYQALTSLSSTNYKNNSNARLGRCTNNTIYYERGGNTIDGLLTKAEDTNINKLIFGEGQTAFDNILAKYFLFDYDLDIVPTYLRVTYTSNSTDDYTGRSLRWLVDNKLSGGTPLSDYSVQIQTVGGIPDIVATGYYDWIFKVTYKPYYDFKLDYKRELSHKITTANAPSDPMVNVELFGIQSQEQLQRMSNDTLGFAMRVDDELTINSLFNNINVGQCKDDYVLTKLECQIYNDYTLIKGILNKNYINHLNYVAMDRTKRYTSLSSDNIVDRHDIEVQDVKVRLNSTPNTSNSALKYVTQRPKIARITLSTSEGSKYLGAFPIVAQSGNLIAYTIDFNNNVYMGLRSDKMLTNNGLNYPRLEAVKYVDSNGECNNPTVKYCMDSVLFHNTNADMVRKFPDDSSNLVTTSNLYTDSQNTIFTKTFSNLMKDSREKLILTTIFNIISNDTNIIIGNNASAILNGTFYLVESSSIIKPSDQYFNISNATIYNVADGLSFNISGNIALCDNDGNLIMAINNYTSGQYIYFE